MTDFMPPPPPEPPGQGQQGQGTQPQQGQPGQQSQQTQQGQQGQGQPRPGPSSGLSTGTAFQNTPNVERYVLEADAMRRRQLRSALLHGSRRTWREHPKQWPAVVVGIIAVAVIIAALVVVGAYDKSAENLKKQQQGQSPSATPSAKPRPSDSRAGSPGASPTGHPSGVASPTGTSR